MLTFSDTKLTESFDQHLITIRWWEGLRDRAKDSGIEIEAIFPEELGLCSPTSITPISKMLFEGYKKSGRRSPKRR